MIERTIFSSINADLFDGKAIILIGPRQTGKTTFCKQILDSSDTKTLFLNCDEADVRSILSNTTSSQLKNVIGDAKLIFIDEAQRVKNIGITLKLLVDNFPDVQLLVSGSSAIGLRDEIYESLAGRKYEYTLFPLSFSELKNHFGYIEEKRNLEQRLIYGSYPEVVCKADRAKKVLMSIVDGYLYKDIYSQNEVKRPELLENLVQLLALHIGSEVSYDSLSKELGTDNLTIRRYITLLEKNFVIFRLHAYSRNVGNEIKKGRKIYFWDTGIRNAVINNFTPLDIRTDKGSLFENYLIAEKKKNIIYSDSQKELYFWRTKQQQEIDLIEVNTENPENLLYNAYEFKWSEKKIPKLTKTFENAYKVNEYKVINTDNYIEWL